MKILFLGGGVLLALLALVVIIGYFLPVEHVASRSIQLPVSRGRTWELIADFGASAGWRPGIKSVELLAGKDGRQVWRETGKDNERIDYETVEVDAGRRLVRRIVTEGLPFGGTWTFRLEDEPKGSTLAIVENGQIYNPVFRFVSRFILGHTATIDQYLRAVKLALGEV